MPPQDNQPSSFSDMFASIVDSTPYMRALGAYYAGKSPDGVSMGLPYRADLIGDPELGVLAGGALTAILDHGCGMAVWDSLNEFKPIATLDLRIDYMRAAKPGKDMIVTAKCYKLTRTMGFVRAFAYDETIDDPVAAAQAAFVITSNSPKGQRS
ncbi:PaaI family thioesterase [Asticcacaulis sp. ZE23SCel15]|uniref:PaaI family thioesterase n=1 Tax=Asticcacaulis sp. ZE23SCel15 TaxID=3059027 RepID=UPI00265E1A7E|nr:PaaI family thioesterase [Asticcacaulis sp. ZE23SCel15]WKL56523.1 PaaI family thioesterase [Asticcacaulis sp. ZE23SCel15]